MVQVMLDGESVDQALEYERLRVERLPNGMHARARLLVEGGCDGALVAAQCDHTVGYTGRIEVRHHPGQACRLPRPSP